MATPVTELDLPDLTWLDDPQGKGKAGKDKGKIDEMHDPLWRVWLDDPQARAHSSAAGAVAAPPGEAAKKRPAAAAAIAVAAPVDDVIELPTLEPRAKKR